MVIDGVLLLLPLFRLGLRTSIEQRLIGKVERHLVHLHVVPHLIHAELLVAPLKHQVLQHANDLPEQKYEALLR